MTGQGQFIDFKFAMPDSTPVVPNLGSTDPQLRGP